MGQVSFGNVPNTKRNMIKLKSEKKLQKEHRPHKIGTQLKSTFKKITDIYQVVFVNRNGKVKKLTSYSYSIVGYRNYTTIDFTTQVDTNTDNF